MEIRKLNEEIYGKYIENTLNEYEEHEDLIYMFSNVDKYSKLLKSKGQTLSVNIDIDKYMRIVDGNGKQSEKNVKLSKLLYEDFKKIPINIMLDKYVWAYMNIKIFYEVIQKHIIDYRLSQIRKSDEEKKKEMKGLISRHYFSKVPKSKITRSGMRWLWYCAYILEGDTAYIEKTQKYIDPVRAMFERNFSNDRNVLKAYIDCIEKISIAKKRNLNDRERTTVATHIYCVGAVSRFATYEREELINYLEEQANYMIEK